MQTLRLKLLLLTAALAVSAQGPLDDPGATKRGEQAIAGFYAGPATLNKREDGCRGVTSTALVGNAEYSGPNGTTYSIAGIWNMHPQVLNRDGKVTWACEGYVELHWKQSGRATYGKIIAHQNTDGSFSMTMFNI